MPRIDIPDELDAQVETVLPPHFRGERKASLRVEHVLRQWLTGARSVPLSDGLPEPRDQAPAVGGTLDATA